MKKLCCIALLMAVMGACMSAPCEAADLRIGVIDFDKLLKESKAVRDVRGLFLLKVERERGLLRSEDESIAKKEKAYIEAKERLSDDERRSRQSEIVNLRTALKNKQADANRRLKEEDVQIMRNIRSDIDRIADAMLAQEGFALVVDRKSVFAMPSGADITDQVLRIYDTNQKAK